MSDTHVFRIEVTAVPHRRPKDEKSYQNWKDSVETAIAKKLLYVDGEFSAIVRVLPEEC